LGFLQKGTVENYTKEIRLAQLKRDLILSRGEDLLRISPDGSTNYLYSTREKRILFGKEFVQVYKVQEGVKIRGWQNESSVRITDTEATFSSRPFDGIELTQKTALWNGESQGYVKLIEVVNKSAGALKLRIIIVHDPTSLQFRRPSDPPSEVGVNAFNRGTHVVMDDVADTAGVRVIGTSLQPDYIYMTKDKARISELLKLGEVPGQTAGMSGAIAILIQKDLELSFHGSAKILVASIYDSSKLEQALSEFNSGISGKAKVKTGAPNDPLIFASSSRSLDFAFDWAKTTLRSVRGSDLLDRVSSAFGVGLLNPDRLEKLLDEVRETQSKAGYIPHAQDSGRPGVLETSVYIDSVCSSLQVRYEKKRARKWFSSVRRAGDWLRKQTKDGLISTDDQLPQGWRRRLKSGYPSGRIVEVNLAATKALRSLSRTSQRLGKSPEGARFRESSDAIARAVQSQLTDSETGTLALNRDSRDRLHTEPTIDQASALYYQPLERNVASSVIHRLLERDFETSYGPRVVPNSNQNYFHSTYGDGQLGGVWPRSVLAYALAAYRSGYPVVGSVQLEKLATLVHLDSEKLGGIPGEFPYWVDPDKLAIMSEGSDVVCASRLLETVLSGDLGLSLDGERLEFSPAKESHLKWLYLSGCFADRVALFVGRGNAGLVVVSNGDNARCDNLHTYSFAEEVESTNSLVRAIMFSTPGQLLCLGNQSPAAAGTTVEFPLRDETLRKHLSGTIEELDPQSWRWTQALRVKIWEKMNFRTEIASHYWKMVRLVAPS
jgi:hypothetical protein